MPRFSLILPDAPRLRLNSTAHVYIGYSRVQFEFESSRVESSRIRSIDCCDRPSRHTTSTYRLNIARSVNDSFAWVYCGQLSNVSCSSLRAAAGAVSSNYKGCLVAANDASVALRCDMTAAVTMWCVLYDVTDAAAILLTSADRARS